MTIVAVVVGLLLALAGAAALVGARSVFAAERQAMVERVERTLHPPLVPEGVRRLPATAKRALHAVARMATPAAREAGQTRATLARAGFRREGATEVYYATRVLATVVLAAGVLSLRAILDEPLPYHGIELLAIAAGALGFYVPALWLKSRVTRRGRRLLQSLPDALDLMVISVEAGLGLEAALTRIARELALSSPVLAAELRQTTMEIQAGMPRAEAFRRLADRTQLDALHSLAATLIQTETFGTSIATALRVHAESERIDRTHRAEERAATVSVKMMLPLVLCILPTLIAVIIGPAIARAVIHVWPIVKGIH